MMNFVVDDLVQRIRQGRVTTVHTRRLPVFSLEDAELYRILEACASESSIVSDLQMATVPRMFFSSQLQTLDLTGEIDCSSLPTQLQTLVLRQGPPVHGLTDYLRISRVTTLCLHRIEMDLNLTESHISTLHLTEMTSRVNLPKGLQQLVLVDADLGDLPLPSSLHTLRCIDSDVCLAQMSSTLVNCHQLHTLDLRGNALHDGHAVKRVLSTLPRLHKLILADNDFTSIPPVSIPILDLTCNRIEHAELQSEVVHTLQLSHNSLQTLDLPDTLQRLDLQACQVNDWDDMRLPRGLTHLDVSHNSLSEVLGAQLRALPHLQSLQLEACEMTPAIFTKLNLPVTLKRLDLSYNLLDDYKAIASWISTSQHLQRIDLRCNGKMLSFAEQMCQDVSSLVHATRVCRSLTQCRVGRHSAELDYTLELNKAGRVLLQRGMHWLPTVLARTSSPRVRYGLLKECIG